MGAIRSLGEYDLAKQQLAMIEKLCGKDYEYYEDLAGVDGGARALVQSWTRGGCRGARLSRRKGQDNISGLIHARRRRGVPDGESTFDADLNFLSRWDGPLGLLARAMSGLHFYRRGRRQDRGLRSRHRLHADPGSRWAAAAVGHSDRTRRCLLVLFGFKTRWVAIALFGFCLLTGAFFHTGAEQAIPTSQERRHGRWLSRSGAARPWRRVVARRLAGASRLARAVAEALPRSRRVERLIWAMPRPYRLRNWGLTPADIILSSAGIFRWSRPPCRSISARPIESLSVPVPSAHFPKVLNVERRRQADQQSQARRQSRDSE